MKREWTVTVDDLESIAIGAGIFGTGGGGNPYIGKLAARRAIRAAGEIPIIPVDSFPDEGLVCTVGGMGAPTVTIEKVISGTETFEAMRVLEGHLGRKFTAVIPAEIGGGNSIEPLLVAARAGLPVLDGDGMGRAFPEMPMITYFIYGVSPFPCALADEKGNQVIYPRGVDAAWLERLSRGEAVLMGGHAGCAVAVMSGLDVKRTAIRDTLSMARFVGSEVRRVRAASGDVISAIVEATGGRRLFQGKIVDVERRTARGWASGCVHLEGTGDDRGHLMRIAFRNENLAAWIDEQVVATVPDLICICHADDGEPITTELLRYGYRVVVIGIECDDKLKTPEAIAVVGPRAFGLDLDYVPGKGE